MYRADSIVLDIIELARSKHDFLDIEGSPEYDKCEDLAYAQPITFTTEESMIEVPQLTLTDSGSIKFTFRTIEQTGVIMYSPGVSGVTDFFALELIDGSLYLVLNAGIGVIRLEATSQGVNVTDGEPHVVRLTYTGSKFSSLPSGSSEGSISIDGKSKTFEIDGRNELELQNVLYIGDVQMVTGDRQIPPEILSAAIKGGYVGCFQELMVNSERVDIAQLARTQKVQGLFVEKFTVHSLFLKLF